MVKVYIINRGAGHDYSPATKFGELVYLSDGAVDRTNTGLMVRVFWPVLRQSFPDDYILLSSMSIMCSIACAIMGSLHSRLNLLIYEKGHYIERKILLNGSDTNSTLR